jgi:hypothetical protein
LGPGVANGFITAGKPTRLINGPGAKKMTRPVTNQFEFNPQTLKDAVGFRVSEPERIIHPNLKPTVNFSLPTTTKRLDALNLREDINKDTSDLEGSDLLSKLVTYVMDLYKMGSSPFELAASPFQSLINACKRLNLNSDPTLAGLPKTVDQRMPFGTFVKVNIWLMGADQVFDKDLKPGYIYIAQQRVPVSTLVAPNRPKAFVLDLYNRRASIGVADPTMKDIAEGPRLPDVGQVPQGGPNLADGRDGKQNVANQDPVKPADEEVKSMLNVTAKAVDEAAALQQAIESLERPQALKYEYKDPFGQQGEDPYGDPVQEVAQALVEEEVKALEVQPTAEEIYEREAQLAEQVRERIAREMLTAPGDPFLRVFQLYAQEKDDEAKSTLTNILNTKNDDGSLMFPSATFLASYYVKDPNRVIEALGDIRRNGSRDRFLAPNSRVRFDPYEVKVETYKYLKDSAWNDVLTGGFGPTTNAELTRELRKMEKEDAWVYHYLNSRSQYTPAEKWRSLQRLMQTKGQKGFGRRKAPKRKKTKKRAKPY